MLTVEKMLSVEIDAEWRSGNWGNKRRLVVTDCIAAVGFSRLHCQTPALAGGLESRLPSPHGIHKLLTRVAISTPTFLRALIRTYGAT